VQPLGTKAFSLLPKMNYISFSMLVLYVRPTVHRNAFIFSVVLLKKCHFW